MNNGDISYCFSEFLEIIHCKPQPKVKVEDELKLMQSLGRLKQLEDVENVNESSLS